MISNIDLKIKTVQQNPMSSQRTSLHIPAMLDMWQVVSTMGRLAPVLLDVNPEFDILYGLQKVSGI